MVYIQPKWISGSLCLFIMAFLHPHRVGANDVTYDELIELKADCGNLDNCQGYRTTDDMRFVNCQCGPVCAKLGTCCVDSKYRTPGVGPENNNFAPIRPHRSQSVVFMVSNCSSDWAGDKGIKDHCEIPEDRAYMNDPFLLMPVTILSTGITYKNYYCLACNEDRSSDLPVVWDLHLATNKRSFPTGGANPTLEKLYDYAIEGFRFFSIAEVPEKLHPYLNFYRQDVISTCDEEWTDVTIKEKCSAYTALVYYYEKHRSPIYKNPHCAICNYRNVSRLWCSEPSGHIVWGGIPIGFQVVIVYPLVDRAQRCAENEVFDNYQKKCRAIRCGPNQQEVHEQCSVYESHCPWYCGSSNRTTTSPGTEQPVQEDDIGDATLSPSFPTETPETPSSTENPVTSQRPRPRYPTRFRIPVASTGKKQPRPQNTTSDQYDYSHPRINHNFRVKSHSVKGSYFISTV